MHKNWGGESGGQSPLENRGGGFGGMEWTPPPRLNKLKNDQKLTCVFFFGLIDSE